MLATRRAATSALPALPPFLAYLRLEVRRSLRNRRYLVFTVVFPVMLYVLYTAVLPATASGPIAGLPWNVYFLVSMAAYGAMGAAMSQANPIATERRQGWARQLRVTPLPSLAYVAAKVASAVLLTVPALALVGAAGQVVNHVDLGLPTWAATIAVLGHRLDPVRRARPAARLPARRRERPGRDGPVATSRWRSSAACSRRSRPSRPASLRLAACSPRRTSRASAGPSWPGSSPTRSTSSCWSRGRSRSARWPRGATEPTSGRGGPDPT